MQHLNLISARSKSLGLGADFARAARLTRVAVCDAIDSIETAADIAVEAHEHYRRSTRPRYLS